MKVIVQAGGLGTRMQTMTATKPKALIDVRNKPILFHLFDAFPQADFIVVGDYQYDVLDRYLTTFASERRCILVKACGKGNAAGLSEAISYVGDGVCQERFPSIFKKPKQIASQQCGAFSLQGMSTGALRLRLRGRLVRVKELTGSGRTIAHAAVNPAPRVLGTGCL